MPYKLISVNEPASAEEPYTDFWLVISDLIPIGIGHYQILEGRDGEVYERHMALGNTEWYVRKPWAPDEDIMPGYEIIEYEETVFDDEGDHIIRRYGWKLEGGNMQIISRSYALCKTGFYTEYPFETIEECEYSIRRHRHQALSNVVSYPTACYARWVTESGPEED